MEQATVNQSKEYRSISMGSTLSGVGLVAARIVWAGVTLMTVFLFLTSIPSSYAFNHQEAVGKFGAAIRQVGISPTFYAGYRVTLDVLEALAFAATGLFIFIRKSNDWMVMLISVGFTTFGSLFVPTLARLSELHPIYTAPVGFVRTVGLATSLIAFYYLFPTGRFVPGWTRWLAAGWVALALVWLVAPGAPANLVYLDTWMENLALSFLVFVAWYGSGVVAQRYRYVRISTAVERQQTKWVVYGTTMAVVGFILYYLPIVLIPALQETGVVRLYHILLAIPIFHLFVLMAPLTMAISILRFRLWDIDFLINRSLVYLAVSGMLAVVYFGLVTGLSLLFWDPAADRQPVIIPTLATLVIVFLFSPLRQRVQNMIDRRFYRKKYNAAQALLEFGATVQGEVDLERLSQGLVTIIQSTIQPAKVSLWLKKPSEEDQDSGQELPFRAKDTGITFADLTRKEP